MEYTEEFNDLRKAMIIKHLRYKREFILYTKILIDIFAN